MQNHVKNKELMSKLTNVRGKNKEMQLELQMMSNFPIASNTNSWNQGQMKSKFYTWPERYKIHLISSIKSFKNIIESNNWT